MEMEVYRDLGEHDAKIESLQKQLQALHGDLQQLNAAVRDIKQTLDQAKGGWRTLMSVCGVGAAVGVAAAKTVAWLTTVPVPK